MINKNAINTSIYQSMNKNAGKFEAGTKLKKFIAEETSKDG